MVEEKERKENHLHIISTKHQKNERGNKIFFILKIMLRKPFCFPKFKVQLLVSLVYETTNEFDLNDFLRIFPTFRKIVASALTFFFGHERCGV
jgi:hypothetical protein